MHPSGTSERKQATLQSRPHSQDHFGQGCILAITETWLTDDVSEGKVSVPDFHLFQKDRFRKAGGGICIYAHHFLRLNVLSTISHPDIEMLWLRIHGKDKQSPFHVGCLYWPPSERVEFWSNLEGALEDLVGLDVLLMEDLNVDVLNPRDVNFAHLMAVCAPLQLSNTVLEPTRMCATSQKCIDPILTNCTAVSNVAVSHLDFSDHALVTAHIKLSTSARSKPVLQFKRRFNASSLRLLPAALARHNAHTLQSGSIDVMWQV